MFKGMDARFLLAALALLTAMPLAAEVLPVIPVAVDVQPAAAEEKPASRSRLMEEIIVTAQKREENLQDVPISVQAFSAELLDARGITDQKELPQITPGLDIGIQVSYTTIFLRGVGTDAFLTADPSVATYIDGIYFPFAQGLTQDFGAVERIEVLKGPQGTLFGRNTTGGAISIVTQTPDFADSAVSIQTSVANYPDLQTRIHTNVPLSDTFAFSVSALYNKTEFYIDATADGKPLPEDVSRGARLKTRWKPADWLELNLAALKLRVTGAAGNFTPSHTPTPLGRLVGIRGEEPYSAELDTAIFNELDNTVYYGQLEFFNDALDIKLLGSNQDIDTSGQYDFDGSPLPLVSFLPPNNFARVQSAELQLLSNNTSWASEWFKWIVGGYYFHGYSGFDPILGIFGGIDLSGQSGAGVALPPGFRDALDTQLALIGGRVPTGQLDIRGTLSTNSLSTFFQTTFSFTDWLDLTLGGRYQEERRTIGKSSTGFQTLGGEPIFFAEYNFALDQDGDRIGPSDTTKKFSPKVSLELRPFEDDTLTYLSYQQATKSSTYNTTAITGPPSYVGPETLTAYELGIKTTLFDGLTRFNAALFHYDIEDLQVQFFALLNGGIVSFENAPKARSQGFEFDLLTEVLPGLFDQLVFSIGGAFIDAEYTDFPDGSGYDEETGIFSRNRNLTGKRIVRSPKFSGNLSLGKTWDLARGPIEVISDFYYNDGFFYEATNISRSEQKAYEIFGARISYLYEPWDFRVTLFGKNLGNQAYTQGGLPNDFGDALNFAPRRTYGIRLNWDF